MTESNNTINKKIKNAIGGNVSNINKQLQNLEQGNKVTNNNAVTKILGDPVGMIDDGKLDNLIKFVYNVLKTVKNDNKVNPYVTSLLVYLLKGRAKNKSILISILNNYIGIKNGNEVTGIKKSTVKKAVNLINNTNGRNRLVDFSTNNKLNNGNNAKIKNNSNSRNEIKKARRSVIIVALLKAIYKNRANIKAGGEAAGAGAGAVAPGNNNNSTHVNTILQNLLNIVRNSPDPSKIPSPSKQFLKQTKNAAVQLNNGMINAGGAAQQTNRTGAAGGAAQQTNNNVQTP